MAVLPILKYPDQRLHTVAKPVDKFDDSEKKDEGNTTAAASKPCRLGVSTG